MQARRRHAGNPKLAVGCNKVISMPKMLAWLYPCGTNAERMKVVCLKRCVGS
jgi:hypothetical protein